MPVTKFAEPCLRYPSMPASHEGSPQCCVRVNMSQQSLGSEWQDGTKKARTDPICAHRGLPSTIVFFWHRFWILGEFHRVLFLHDFTWMFMFTLLLHIYRILYIYLVGGLEHLLFFHIIGNNNTNWLIFFRGVQATNQIRCVCVCFTSCSIHDLSEALVRLRSLASIRATERLDQSATAAQDCMNPIRINNSL